ncbi:MAG: ferric reductase-like transmembrane domain-containing protein [Anaerolineae bacterium]
MVKDSPWMDRLSFIFSLIVVIATGLWIWQQGALRVNLTEQTNGNWYLERSAGITAYSLLLISVVWGIAVTSRVVKDWSPGVLSMLLHSTISWLAVVFSLTHALLLLLDKYVPYTLADILIPFTGPYRPLAVGLGTLAFWIGLIVAASFSIKKRLGQRAWKALHLTSYVAFGLVTAHALLAGTDAAHIGFQILLALGVLLVIALLAYRVRKAA